MFYEIAFYTLLLSNIIFFIYKSINKTFSKRQNCVSTEYDEPKIDYVSLEKEYGEEEIVYNLIYEDYMAMNMHFYKSENNVFIVDDNQAVSIKTLIDFEKFYLASKYSKLIDKEKLEKYYHKFEDNKDVLFMADSKYGLSIWSSRTVGRFSVKNYLKDSYNREETIDLFKKLLALKGVNSELQS